MENFYFRKLVISLILIYYAIESTSHVTEIRENNATDLHSRIKRYLIFPQGGVAQVKF